MSNLRRHKEVIGRSEEQLREQYELEKRLAEKLRNSGKEEREVLYKLVYDELFKTTHDHPQAVRKIEPERGLKKVAREFAVVRHFIGSHTTFLEIGAGDCQFSMKVAEHVCKAYAIEVSEELTAGLKQPANFELIVGDACSFAIPSGSVDFAYSNQVLEHLHPEDAMDHLRRVHAVLGLGGTYMCRTPNRLNGPWDVSRYFDLEARGLHLREYTNGELADLCKMAGFKRVRVYVRAKGLHLTLPVFPFRWLEAVLSMFPAEARGALANWYPVRRLLGVNLVAAK